MADHLRVELVLDALTMAIRHRQPAAGLIQHSDHGCQCTSLAFGHQLQAAGIVPSIPWAWSGRLRQRGGRKLLRDAHGRAPAPPDLAAARLATFEFIEVWYNRQRRHSTRGYATPTEDAALAQEVTIAEHRPVHETGASPQDLDLERGTLSIRSQLQRAEGALRLVEPKTARSRRTLQLPAVAIEALRAHKVRQLEERLAAGPAWRDSGLVFTTAIGTPLDARNVVRQFHGLLARAGLPRMPFHTLRHTAASLLLAQGLDIRVVQQVLGHSQIGLTANLYAHVAPTLLKDAAERMDAILRIEHQIGHQNAEAEQP